MDWPKIKTIILLIEDRQTTSITNNVQKTNENNFGFDVSEAQPSFIEKHLLVLAIPNSTAESEDFISIPQSSTSEEALRGLAQQNNYEVTKLSTIDNPDGKGATSRFYITRASFWSRIFTKYILLNT